MKYLKIVLIGAMLCNTSLFANEFKGFIALDLFNISKEESSAQDSSTGIGTFDLKFYARHDKFAMKVKLDLDDSNIGENLNIIEEATASYFHTDEIRFSGGKGKVPFHRMRYGVISSHFVDGGSLMGSNHSFRDQDNKLLMGVRLGSYNAGYYNHTTIYAESTQPIKDDAGNVLIEDNGTIKTTNSKTFNSSDQRGIANKFEYFINSSTNISLSALYFYSDYRPKETYALDFGGEKRVDTASFWWEYVYAKVSTHPYDNYSAKDQDEHLAQFGSEKVLNDKYNLLFNVEYAYVDSLRHSEQFTNVNSVTVPSRNNGNRYETTTIKIAGGTKYKLAKSAFVVFGIELEQRETSGISTSDNAVLFTDTKHAYQAGFDFAFWF